MAEVAPAETLLDEITDFLASIPTAAEVMAFKPSTELDQRLQDLLDRAGEGLLTDHEHKELDEFLRVSHLLKMLKGKVLLKFV
jgi:hypothetical protein